jgi:hypothetical protein
VNSVPGLARLTTLAPNIDLRIVNSKTGHSAQEAHRTPDGRTATPTIIVLDEEFHDVGCMVERPLPLRALVDAEKKEGRDFHPALRAWYEKNRGEAAAREVIGLIEAAAAGTPRCEKGSI